MQDFGAEKNQNEQEITPAITSVQEPLPDTLVTDQSEAPENNEDDMPKLLSSKLCNGLETTVGDVVYMCLALGMKHNLTWDAQIDILKMLQTIFVEADIPQSKKKYLKIVDNKSLCLTYLIFCPDCEIYLGKRWENEWSARCYKCQENTSFSQQSVSDNLETAENDNGATVQKCNLNCKKCGDLLGKRDDCAKLWSISCGVCKNDISVHSSSSFFVTLSFEKQLQQLLKDERVVNLLLTHRFTRKKASPGALEDLYDGEEYKKHFDAGVLSSPYNFSYSFFTDGISTGKSTCKTMWPIYANINELPFKERSENTFLCGLYVGPKDPNQLVFLQPFVEEANKLSTEGVTWTHNGNVVNSKVLPLCAVLDSVARWQVLNMQSFHAFYGCTYCYQKQERTVPRKRRFNMEETADERTPESTVMDAMVAFERRNEPKVEDRHYRGVKGPSALIQMLYFNLIWGCAIDYLHSILLGIVKTHMKCLFEASRKKFWINVNERVALSDIMKSIDERLLTINPPSSITRIPRSISMWKNWKASEWRSWILFYCIPCLEGLLKDKYLVHLALLSKAVCILLQKSITRADINEMHRMVMEYCYRFQKYFNNFDTIYNLHLLTHLKTNVLKWGPLWTQNAFCYEGHNRHLLQLYKSPNNVLLQIARRFMVYTAMPSLFQKIVSSYSAVEFSENVLQRKLVRFVRCGKAVLIGKSNTLSLTPEDDLILATGFAVRSDCCVSYERMIYGGMRLTSSAYASGKQNNDSVVLCQNGNIVQINHIIVLPTKVVILLGQIVVRTKRRIIDESLVTIEHLRKVKRLGDSISVSLSEIKCQCIIVQTSDKCAFVSSLPFGCYGD